MKFCISFYLLFFLFLYSKAQNIEWVVTEGTSEYVDVSAMAIDPTTGDVFVVGRFNSTIRFGATILVSKGDYDIFINRYNSSGTLLWTKQMGGTATEYPYNITIDNYGNLYLTGFYRGTADFDGVFLSTYFVDHGNGFLVKLTNNGNLVYARKVGVDRQNFSDSADELCFDKSGNLYFIGKQGMDIVIRKYDPLGMSLWSTFFGGASSLVTSDHGTDIAIDKEGFIYATGRYHGPGIFGDFSLPDSDNSFVIKLNNSGKIIWAKSFFGTANTIEIDKEENIVFAGSLSSYTKFGDIPVSEQGGLWAKMDKNNNFLWVKIIPNIVVGEISIDENENIVSVGTFSKEANFDAIKLPTTSLYGEQFVCSLSSGSPVNWAMKIGDQYQQRWSYPINIDHEQSIYIANNFEDKGLFGCQELLAPHQRSFYVAKVTNLFTEISGPDEICLNSEANFSFSSSGEIGGKIWEGSGAIDEGDITEMDDTNVKVKFDSPGTAYLRIKSTFNNGCSNVPMFLTKTIKVAYPFDVTTEINGLTNICSGQKRVEYTIRKVPSVSNYEWNLPAGVTLVKQNDTSLVVDFEEDFIEGFFHVKVSNLCKEATLAPFKVTSTNSVPDAGAIKGLGAICTEVSKIILTTEEIPSTLGYKWKLPEGVVAVTGSSITNKNQIELAFISNDAHDQQITVRGFNSCGDGKESTPFTFRINHLPDPPEEIKSAPTVCKGEMAEFWVTPVEGASEYIWKFSEGMTDIENGVIRTTQNQIKVDIINSGIVSVHAINVCGIGKPAVYKTKVTTLDDFEVPVIRRYCNILVNSSSSQDFEWYFQGERMSGVAEVKIKEPGTYSLVNNTPCGILMEEIVLEEKDLQTFVPSVFTPNNDGYNDFFIVSNDLLNSKVLIFNRWGNCVYTSDNYVNNWDGKNVASGAYFYLIHSPCSEKPIKGTISILR